MRILIVEDNPYVSRALISVLKAHYQVDVVGLGFEAIEVLGHTAFDLVMLDLGLPDLSGLMVIKALREQRLTMPVLTLTALDSVHHKVRMLDAGADDYLTKPFQTPELMARIRALLRRGVTHVVTEQIVHGPLVLDITAHTVTVYGKAVSLRRREFDVLEYLLRNRNMVLTRTMLFDHVWDSHSERWSNVVDSQIKSLRRKIDRRFGITVITTRYGLGYVIETWAEPESPPLPE